MLLSHGNIIQEGYAFLKKKLCPVLLYYMYIFIYLTIVIVKYKLCS